MEGNILVVNHGGNLSKEYFTAYMKLIMKAKNCSAACAKDDMFQKFFKNNPNYYGPSSFEQFKLAFIEIQ